MLARLLLLASLPTVRADGAVPCAKMGTCGGNFNVLPTDANLLFDGYVHMAAAHDGAHMDRAPFGREGSDGRMVAPGARITFRTDAHRVQAIMVYHGHLPCHPECPRLADDKTCYKAGGPCPAQCEVLVEIDGMRTRVPHTNLVGQSITHESKQRDFLGEVKLVLMDQGDASVAAAHTYTLVLPWGAPVDLKRVHVEHPTGVSELPRLFPPIADATASLAAVGASAAERRLAAAAARAPKYVAYGDAATIGWCAELGYPSLLASLNGWNAVNLGLVGGLVEPAHGSALAGQGADLISILLGASEWDACKNSDVGAPFAALLATIRATQPDVPIVVVTPLVSWRDGRPCAGAAAVTPEATRSQIGEAVRARQAGGDTATYLVDGRTLVPPSYLADGLHPGTHGMRELAHNLNAQMGFGAIAYEVVQCPVLTVAVRGLAPNSWLDLYWGRHTESARLIEEGAGCHGRSLMLEPLGKVSTQADSAGRANVIVGQVDRFDRCHSTAFQVVEGTTCTSSRLGHVSTTFSSRVGTPAEGWQLWPPPPPPRRDPAAQASATPQEGEAPSTQPRSQQQPSQSQQQPSQSQHQSPQNQQPPPQNMHEPQHQPHQPQPHQPHGRHASPPSPPPPHAAAPAGALHADAADRPGAHAHTQPGVASTGEEACTSAHSGDSSVAQCAAWCKPPPAQPHPGAATHAMAPPAAGGLARVRVPADGRRSMSDGVALPMASAAKGAHCAWCKCADCAFCRADATPNGAHAAGHGSGHGGWLSQLWAKATASAGSGAAHPPRTATNGGAVEGGANQTGLMPAAAVAAATGGSMLGLLACAGAVSGLLGALLLRSACRGRDPRTQRRRGHRYARTPTSLPASHARGVDEIARADGGELVPAHFEVGAGAVAVAVQLTAVQSLPALRAMLSDVYAEVVGMPLPHGGVRIEYEGDDGTLHPIEDSAPFRKGHLHRAISLRVTASRRR